MGTNNEDRNAHTTGTPNVYTQSVVTENFENIADAMLSNRLNEMDRFKNKVDEQNRTSNKTTMGKEFLKLEDTKEKIQILKDAATSKTNYTWDIKDCIKNTKASELATILNNDNMKNAMNIGEIYLGNLAIKNITKIALTVDTFKANDFINKLDYTNKCTILKDKDVRNDLIPKLSQETKFALLEELKKDKFSNKDIRNALKTSIKKDIETQKEMKKMNHSIELKSPDAKYNTAFTKLKNEVENPKKQSSQAGFLATMKNSFASCLPNNKNKNTEQNTGNTI